MVWSGSNVPLLRWFDLKQSSSMWQVESRHIPGPDNLRKGLQVTWCNFSQTPQTKKGKSIQTYPNCTCKKVTGRLWKGMPKTVSLENIKSMYFWFPVSWRQNSLMERESPLNPHPQSVFLFPAVWTCYRWSVRSHKNCGLEPHLRGDEHLQNKLKHNAMRFDIFHFQDQVNLGGRPKPKCWSQVVKSHTLKSFKNTTTWTITRGKKSIKLHLSKGLRVKQILPNNLANQGLGPTKWLP